MARPRVREAQVWGPRMEEVWTASRACLGCDGGATLSSWSLACTQMW